MGRGMSQKDFYDIISAKSSISPTTVRKVWQNIRELIISELQNNSYIGLDNFGKFEIVKKGGKDEWFENKMGIQEKKYVEPFDFTEFIPSTNFINTINGGMVDSWSKARFDKDELTTYDKVLLGIETEETTDEIIFELLEKKKKTQIKARKRDKLYQNGTNLGKTDLTKARPVYCITNKTKYPSVYKAARTLGIRLEKIYIKFKQGDFNVDGYEFEYAKDENSETGSEQKIDEKL